MLKPILIGEYRRYRLFEVEKITRAGNLYPRDLVEKAIVKAVMNQPIYVVLGTEYPMNPYKIIGQVGGLEIVNNHVEVSLIIDRSSSEGKIWDKPPDDLMVSFMVSVVVTPVSVDGVRSHNLIKEYTIHHVTITETGLKGSKYLKKGRVILDQFISGA